MCSNIVARRGRKRIIHHGVDSCGEAGSRACLLNVSLTRRYTRLLASIDAVAVVRSPLLNALDPRGEHCFRLAPEPRRSGDTAIAVLHDGTRHVGYLAPEIAAVVHQLMERLGPRARRLWVYGDVDDGEARLRLPSLEQVRQWML